MALDKLKRGAKANSPTILITMGILNSITAVATGIIAAPAYFDERKYRLEHNDGKPLDIKEEMTLAAKHFWKPAVLETLSIGCIVGANKIHISREMSYAGLIATSNSTQKLFEEKAREIVGDEKFQEIKSEVAKEKIASVEIPTEVDPDDGKVWFVEASTQQKFRADPDEVRDAIGDAYCALDTDMPWISQNDIFCKIDGMRCIPAGEDNGVAVENKDMLHPTRCLTIERDTDVAGLKPLYIIDIPFLDPNPDWGRLP